MSKPLIGWDDFENVDLRAGTVVEVRSFPKARKPAYQLRIDFGDEIGMKWSSAQITRRYSQEELLGRQIIAVVNFPPKRIADFLSEVLVTGFVLPDGEVILAMPDHHVPNGAKLA